MGYKYYNKFQRMIMYPFRHLIGKGYSHCGCCGFPWNRVPTHNIWITKEWGMIPICENCWKTKSDKQIIKACNKLYDSWLSGDKLNKPIPQEEMHYTREQMLDAVDEALKERNKCDSFKPESGHGDWYLTKHISFHFTIQPPIWEFHVLPFIDISEWRILGGWLCFTFQYTYKTEEEWMSEQ